MNCHNRPRNSIWGTKQAPFKDDGYFTALYDACVLYPAPLRDLLMRLALTDLFRARWTDDIHEEWMRSLLANRPDLTR